MSRTSIKKLLRPLFLLLALAPAALFGQTTMSLAEAIQFAVANNPSIRIAQIQIQDAEWQIRENKATGLPQLTAGLNYQYFFQTPVAVLPEIFGINPQTGEVDPNFDRTVSFALTNSLGAQIQVNHLIFSNSYRVALKAAQRYRLLVQQQYEVAVRTVRNQVTDAYLPALLIEQNLDIFAKNIGNLERLLGETQQIQQAGFAEQLDVDRLQLSLSNLRTERENLERQRLIVVNALKMTMGYAITDSLALSDNLDQLIANYAQADLATTVDYMKRPEYLQLLRGQDLSSMQIDLNSRTWMPNIAWFASYSPSFAGNNLFKEAFFTPQGLVGVSVNFTLYDGGAARARRERALLGVATILEQKKQLESAIQLEVENSRKQYLNAAQRVRNQQQNLALAERIFNTTQIKYKNGIGSSLEMSQAEQQLYAAQQALMQSQFDLLTANVAVRKALGEQ
jgi:outer membrane protein